MSQEIIPFGKHKGKNIEALLDDRPYLEWLLSQSWFKEKFGNVYNIVINAGNEPVDTPEHNQMQARFLDPQFRLEFLYTAGYPTTIKRTENPVFESGGIDVQFDWWIIEIKPTVGDDWPAVMRQLKSYRSGSRSYRRILFLREYTGKGITSEQFVQMFTSQEILVVFESDVDQKTE